MTRAVDQPVFGEWGPGANALGLKRLDHSIPASQAKDTAPQSKATQAGRDGFPGTDGRPIACCGPLSHQAGWERYRAASERSRERSGDRGAAA